MLLFLIVPSLSTQSEIHRDLNEFDVYLRTSSEIQKDKALYTADFMHEVPEEYADCFTDWAFDYNPAIILAIASVESNWNANAIGSRNSNGTYDYGLMQLNGAYISKFINDYWNETEDFLWYNGIHSMYIAIRHFQYLYERVGEDLAIHAYNIGIGAVLRGKRNYVYYKKIQEILWSQEKPMQTEKIPHCVPRGISMKHPIPLYGL